MRPASRRTWETARSSESTSMLAWPVRITIPAATLALASAGAVRLAAQMTVVTPLESVPRRRLENHAPRLLSCPATQYPDSLKRRAIGGHVVLEVVVDTLGRVPRDRIVVRETPHPG